jgi:23S rRNA pseudouridine2605 synthase
MNKKHDAASPRQAEPAKSQRIAKVIARSGLCSRRDAERLIEEGRVAVNGAKIAGPAMNVSPEDEIVVDGAPLPAPQAPQLWRYHKPKGRVTSHRDPQGRPTVFEALPEEMPRVISVGRLDFNSEGLLLLTNDGELARHLERPQSGWLRRYRARARGRITQEALDKLSGGVEIEGVRYGPIEARLDREREGANIWVTVSLREGKNREVRIVLEHMGLTVNRLIRVAYGPFQLGDLTPGAVEEIKPRVVAQQLGEDAARALGLARRREAEIKQKQEKHPKRNAPAKRPAHGRPTSRT